MQPRSLLLVLLVLSGCQMESPAMQPAHSPVAETSAMAWDPRQPVDVSDLETQDFFVVTETASLCPTVAQAIANECGSSVESVDQGSRRRRGERVIVVGNEPVDGVWRAIRNTKLGDLPAWVDGERVAPEPDISHLETFRRDHEDALVLRGEQLRVVTGGGVEGALALQPPVFTADTDDGRIFFDPPECLANPDDPDDEYAFFHGCLIYGDCGELDYVCDKDEYCDEIAIVTGPAKEFRRKFPQFRDGTWTKAERQFTGYPIEKLADRFGVFVDCDVDETLP